MLDLSAQQTRQLIDCEQLYATYRDTIRELATRYTGSMTWKTVKGRTYLYRKTDGVWKSLGGEDDRTREAHAAFHAGRATLRERRDRLDQRLREMAPVNRALRLGRVPVTSARIIRRLDREGMLGRGLKIVGTHALYAYEMMGGVQLGEEAMTTMDIDILYDTRRSLKVVGDVRADGLVGLLQGLDGSFRATAPGSFRAVNDTGYMVDLITPTTRFPADARPPAQTGDPADDLVAVEIAGLAWLENVPVVERIVIDERGFPLWMAVPDPRAFLCHKLWVAGRDDRDVVKQRRDRHQAHTLAKMLATRLPAMRIDDPVLSAVPKALRRPGANLLASFSGGDAAGWDD